MNFESAENNFISKQVKLGDPQPKSSLQRNILFGFLSWLLPLASTLVVTPFVVRWIGVEQYGLLALVLGFISYSFNFGIARAATKYIAEYRHANDERAVEEVLSATLLLNLLVGAGGAGLLILLTNYLVKDVLLIEVNLQSSAILAFYIAAVTIAFSMLQTVFVAVLQAVGRFDWFSHLTTLISTLLSVGNLILAWRNADAVDLLWWNLAATLFSTGLFASVAKRALPNTQLRFRIPRRIVGQVTAFSVGVIGYQISGNLLLLFERSWITREFGTEGVTFYAVPMILAIYLHVFITSLTMALLPLTSEISAARNAEGLRQLYQRATKYLYLIIIFANIALAIGGKSFLTLWLDADFAERSWAILAFHVVTFAGHSLPVIAWQINEGVGKPTRNAVLSFLWLTVAAPLMLVWGESFGLAGIAAARAAGVWLTAPFFILLVERLIFGGVLWTFWRQILPPLALAGCAGGFMLYLGLHYAPLNWLIYLAANAVSGLVYLLILFASGFFSPAEQRWLRGFIPKIKPQELN